MQMLKSLMIVTVCALAMVLTGCGKKEGSKQSSPSAPDAKKSAPATQAASAPAAQTNAAAPEGAASMPDYAKMAEQNRQTLTQMNQGKTIEAVSAATLKDLLPADLPGMKRTSASGERNQMMGVDLSTAEGRGGDQAHGCRKHERADAHGHGGLGHGPVQPRDRHRL
jgi:3-oxoacyl-ACP reductase-like protein